MRTQQTNSPVDAPQAINPSAEAILDSLGDAVVVVGRDGSVLYRNQQAQSALPEGSDIDQLFGTVRHLGKFDGWSDVIDRTLAGQEPPSFDCALTTPGQPTLFTVRCLPYRSSRDEPPTGVVLTIHSNADCDELDDHLEVSKRLTSLGKLATRVAHELNNPLDGILRYVNLAMRVATDEPESKLKSYLAESRTGLMRMIQIIGELLEFSRTTEGEFDEIEVGELVEQSVRDTTSAAAKNGVVITVDIQNQPMPAVRGSRLYQVCCNLIKNAIDAMPNGGRLTVTTGLVEDDVLIRVSDTGEGLPEPIDRVFEAFFTTKPAGEGTGLGLAICRDFIEEMRGTIEAENGPTGGAVFTVRVPVAECLAGSPLNKNRHAAPER